MAVAKSKLTDKAVSMLAVPAAGSAITFDAEHKGKVSGFGVRVAAGGTRAFILTYRTRAGRDRCFTIGRFPTWQTVAARNEARTLRQAIDRGEDPMAEVQADRTAPTVAQLSERFMTEHAGRKRPSTKAFYDGLINNWINPNLGSRKVADISFVDVDALHSKMTKAGRGYMANRALAVLSKMFNLAIKWKLRADNPVKGVERNQEIKRQRYLSVAEITSLTTALAVHEDQQAADIIRMLLLTGARSMEVKSARWDQFDLETGVWTKPGSATKQKTAHRVPLSAPARQLLAEVRQREEGEAKRLGRPVSVYVFPGRGGASHRQEIKRDWGEIAKAAGFTAHTRMHDLRHTYASVLASHGLSLPIIGALLGHTQPATTARYSHLYDDPLRAATERVGTLVAGKPKAEIIDIAGAR